MRETFERIAAHAAQGLAAGEEMTASFHGEESSFVRLGSGRVRQAGSVTQATLTIDLAEGRRHAPATLTLSGDSATDAARVDAAIERLREHRAHLPEDPFWLRPEEPRSTEHRGDDRLPDPGQALDEILDETRGADLVGLLALGAVHHGFADSRGQRNWHTVHTFHLDWSVHLDADRAVKGSYAGTEWSSPELAARLRASLETLRALARPPERIAPGGIRVYLAPEALAEIFDVLGWGGFSLQAHRTRTSGLARMTTEGARLDRSVTVLEDARGGLAPPFQEQGFLRPDRVTMIEGGILRELLVSPRSAAEYGVACNGASDYEAPRSLDLAPGDLREAEAAARVGDGLWIGNLHYLNYSDRPAGRLTGLTRFGTFRVRGGEITGPLEVMRFDETVFRTLGENLLALTRERHRIVDPSTYERRSTRSALLPGALIEDFRFTL